MEGTLIEEVGCPFGGELAKRLRVSRDDLTLRWLDRISARVTVNPIHIFPSQELLNHVPLLIDGIADYMESAAEDIGADVPVIDKAMELGEMRLSQGFGVYEILKEYEILGGVLFAFLIETVETVDEECSRGELLSCAQRLFRAVSFIQQITAMQFVRIADAQVRERENRLRSFNRTVTHELKNRIGVLRGASSMLQEPFVDEVPEERHRFAAIVERNAAGMQEVLQDLLSISRMDGSSRQQSNVLLPKAVAEAARQLREMAEERGVEIRLAHDFPNIEVDAAAVELCLINYISNGIKYADPAKPAKWVRVGAHRTEAADGDEVIIEVRDNGIGISTEARGSLFSRFFRVDDTSETEGTGLGLSIVRETVEALGGRAWGEPGDDEEKGSIFLIALPARREGELEAGEEGPEPGTGLKDREQEPESVPH